MKHPYHSSKILVADCVEKPGTGIFLMKESAKLYKEQKQRTSFKLSKRLYAEEEKQQDPNYDQSGADKRKKLGDGSAMIIPGSSNNTAQKPENKVK